jgi:hypothetical protein
MIRFILGLLLVFGAVGGMDADPDGVNFAAQMALAMLGLLLMYFGTRKLK